MKFAHGLFEGRSQAEAARSAGYKGSAKSLDSVASRLTHHPEVCAELERLRASHAADAVASREELLRRHTEAVRFDLGPYLLFDEQGRCLGLDVKRMLEDGKTHLIQSLDAVGLPGKMGAHKIRLKLEDRQGAADRIARLMGYNAPEKHHHEVKDRPVEEMSEVELEAALRESCLAQIRKDPELRKAVLRLLHEQ